MRTTRPFVLLALAALLAPRIEASRTSVWESNLPAAAVLTETSAAGLLAPLAPAAADDVVAAELPAFDLGDIVLVEGELEHEDRFALGPLDLLGPAPLRGPPSSYPETRVRGFELLPPFRVGASASLSLWPRQACGFPCLGLASDSPEDPWGLESIRQWLDIDSDIESGNFWSALGKTTIYNTLNTFTFGFAAEHDKAFETSSGGEYAARTAAALGKSTAIGAASLATGGGVAAATKGLNLAIAGGLTAGSSTLAGMATEDVINASTGEQTHTAKEYAVGVGGSVAFGAALGAAANRYPSLLDPMGGQPGPLKGGNRLDLARKAELARSGYQTKNPKVQLGSGKGGYPDAVNATNVTEVTQIDFSARGYNANPSSFRSRVFSKVAKTQAYQQALGRPTSTLEIFARPGSAPSAAQMQVILGAQQAYPGVSVRLMGPSATVPIMLIPPRQDE